MRTIKEIEQLLVTPSQDLINEVKKIEGDIIILGISGKIGYNLSALLMNSLEEAGINKKVYGAARFSSGLEERQKFEDLGIKTLVCDFLKEEDLAQLPQVENVIYMVGYKFGSTGNEPYSWAVNSYVPGRIASIYKNSRIVAFSTGCVYPLVKVTKGAPNEDYPLDPVGEYAQSCLGRERIFEYFSRENATPIVIFRLNYAIDVHYGVLLEILQSVMQEEPIDLAMGSVNVIWQPDVSEMAIRSLLHVESPAKVLNITGPETLSVRWIAEHFGKLVNKEVAFLNEESDTALLSNAAMSHKLFGYPKTSVHEMMDILVEWVTQGGEILDKPTHFQEREGKY